MSMSVEPTLERISAFFVGPVADGYDVHRAHTIGLALGRIKRDLTFLDITTSEYRVAAAALIAANEAEWQREQAYMRRAGTTSLVRRMTDEEVAAMEEQSRIGMTVFLRIDTLYFVGSRLLDAVVAAADTIVWPPRGRPRGAKDLGRHRHVRERLQQRAAAGSVPAAPASLFSLIDEVTMRVRDYRDDYVAHPPAPRFPEQRPLLTIRPERHTVAHEGMPSSSENEDLVAVLDRYVNAWLDYLEAIPLPFEWPPAAAK
jgi:hypothetical protein